MSRERSAEVHDADDTRKDYSAPQILWTEKLTARAAVCMRGASSWAPGPIQS